MCTGWAWKGWRWTGPWGRAGGAGGMSERWAVASPPRHALRHDRQAASKGWRGNISGRVPRPRRAGERTPRASSPPWRWHDRDRRRWQSSGGGGGQRRLPSGRRLRSHRAPRAAPARSAKKGGGRGEGGGWSAMSGATGEVQKKKDTGGGDGALSLPGRQWGGRPHPRPHPPPPPLSHLAIHARRPTSRCPWRGGCTRTPPPPTLPPPFPSPSPPYTFEVPPPSPPPPSYSRPIRPLTVRCQVSRRSRG